MLAIGEVTTLAINRDTFTALLGPLKEIMEREHEARMEQEAAARQHLAAVAAQVPASTTGTVGPVAVDGVPQSSRALSSRSASARSIPGSSASARSPDGCASSRRGPVAPADDTVTAIIDQAAVKIASATPASDVCPAATQTQPQVPQASVSVAGEAGRLPGQPEDSASEMKPHAEAVAAASSLADSGHSARGSARRTADATKSSARGMTAAADESRVDSQLHTSLLLSLPSQAASGASSAVATGMSATAAVAIAWPPATPLVVSAEDATPSAMASIDEHLSAPVLEAAARSLPASVEAGSVAIASATAAPTASNANGARRCEPTVESEASASARLASPTQTAAVSGPGAMPQPSTAAVIDASATGTKLIVASTAAAAGDSGSGPTAALMEAALGLPSLSRLQRSMPAIVTGASSRVAAGDVSQAGGLAITEKKLPSHRDARIDSHGAVTVQSGTIVEAALVQPETLGQPHDDGVAPPASSLNTSSFRDRKPPLARLLLPAEQTSLKGGALSTGSKGSSLTFPATATASASVGALAPLAAVMGNLSGRRTPSSARSGSGSSSGGTGAGRTTGSELLASQPQAAQASSRGGTGGAGGVLDGLSVRHSPAGTPLASAGALMASPAGGSATATATFSATSTELAPLALAAESGTGSFKGALSGIAVLPVLAGSVDLGRPGSARTAASGSASASRAAVSTTSGSTGAPTSVSATPVLPSPAAGTVTLPLAGVRSVPSLTAGVGLATVAQAAASGGSLSAGALPLSSTQQAKLLDSKAAAAAAPSSSPATQSSSASAPAGAPAMPASASHSGSAGAAATLSPTTGATGVQVHANVTGLDVRRSPNARSSIVSRTAFFAAALPPIEEAAPVVAPIAVPAGTTRRFSIQLASAGAASSSAAAAPGATKSALIDGLPLPSLSAPAHSTTRPAKTGGVPVGATSTVATVRTASAATDAVASSAGSSSASSLPSASTAHNASTPAPPRSVAAGGAGAGTATSAAAAASGGTAAATTSSKPALSVASAATAASQAAASGPISPTSVAAIDALPRRERPEIRLSDLSSLAVLGEGAFGLVRLVRDRRTGEVMALKAMQKAKIVKLNQQANVCSERRLLARLRHPNVLNLVQSFKDRDCVYLLTEACLGGDLFGCLMRAGGRLLPGDARYYSAVVASVLHYMHSLHVVYRDLKPENLLLDASGRLKVADLGFAKVLAAPDYRTFTLCGTPEYLAPELVQGRGHSFGVDWWALGILLFEMLSGFSPFHDESGGGSQLVIYKNILRGRFRFPPHVTDAAAVDLITQLLQAKPSERLGSLRGGGSDVLKHAFFARVNWEALLRGDVRPPIKPLVTSATDTRNFDEATASLTEPRIVPYVETGDRWDADF